MKKSVFTLLNLFAVLVVQAQWQKVTTPSIAQQVLTDGNTIYLGGYGSVSKSTDNGAQFWGDFLPLTYTSPIVTGKQIGRASCRERV